MNEINLFPTFDEFKEMNEAFSKKDVENLNQELHALLDIDDYDEYKKVLKSKNIQKIVDGLTPAKKKMLTNSHLASKHRLELFFKKYKTVDDYIKDDVGTKYIDYFGRTQTTTEEDAKRSYSIYVRLAQNAGLDIKEN